MIFRFLLLFLLIAFIFWVLKKATAGNSPPRQRNPAPQEPEDMLVCETCGTHIPRSIAVQIDGKTYCCREHAPSEKSSDSADDG